MRDFFSGFILFSQGLYGRWRFVWKKRRGSPFAVFPKWRIRPITIGRRFTAIHAVNPFPIVIGSKSKTGFGFQYKACPFPLLGQRLITYYYFRNSMWMYRTSFYHSISQWRYVETPVRSLVIFVRVAIYFCILSTSTQLKSNWPLIETGLRSIKFK
jgi:hypothetical protein